MSRNPQLGMPEEPEEVDARFGAQQAFVAQQAQQAQQAQLNNDQPLQNHFQAENGRNEPPPLNPNDRRPMREFLNH